MTVACAILCLGVVVSHLHQQLGARAWVSETFTLMMLGACINSVVLLISDRPLSVARSPQIHDLTDYLFVPPLMLQVGFHLHTLDFVRALPVACVFGVVGTLLTVALSSAVLVAASSLGFLHSALSTTQCLLFVAAAAATVPSAILDLLPHTTAASRLMRHVLLGEGALNSGPSAALFACLR